MRPQKIWLIATAVIACLAAIGSTGYRSNCGGNCAAISRVKSIALEVSFALAEQPDIGFSIPEAGEEQSRRLSKLGRCHWIAGARFLVCTNRITEEHRRAKRLIAVCDTAYRNVPRKLIGLAPPTHAVAFADGSHALVSQAEYSRLDLSGFAPLDLVLSAKAE